MSAWEWFAPGAASVLDQTVVKAVRLQAGWVVSRACSAAVNQGRCSFHVDARTVLELGQWFRKARKERRRRNRKNLSIIKPPSPGPLRFGSKMSCLRTPCSPMPDAKSCLLAGCLWCMPLSCPRQSSLEQWSRWIQCYPNQEVKETKVDLQRDLVPRSLVASDDISYKMVGKTCTSFLLTGTNTSGNLTSSSAG